MVTFAYICLVAVAVILASCAPLALAAAPAALAGAIFLSSLKPTHRSAVRG